VEVGISGLAIGHVSGLGRLNRTIILALAGAAPNWQLHVYLREPEQLKYLAREAGARESELPPNIAPHYPGAGWINRFLLEEYDLPRRLGRLRLDAYLGCEFTLPPRAVARRELVVIPDLLPFTRPRTLGWRARLLYRRGLRRSVKRQATLLCISNNTLAALNSIFPHHRCETQVLRPALSPRLFDLASRSREIDRPLQVRGSLHTTAAPGPFLLYVGADGRRKNVSLLVNLHRRLVLEGAYRGSLVLAGGAGRYHTAPANAGLAYGVAQPVRQNPVERTPAVYDLGLVSDADLSQLYAHADLLVNLSAEEGFGYPVLESLAHGTPALVTENSTMASITEGGVVETPLEPETCYQRLVSALGSLSLLRREAAAVPVADYSLESMGRELRRAIVGELQLADVLETTGG
jgi:glycosyltransferase involved in cell wall biosynthesis